MTPNDSELLIRYRRRRCETAFAELVRRYVDLVYSAAARQVGGDADLAKDVAQGVFADLARKAGELSNRPSIVGWIYTSTRYAAAKAVRSDQRRRVREHAASAMQQLHAGSESEIDWNTLRPMLDDVMHELEELDREAVLLRYFQGRDLKTVGSALGVSDDAARKRVERALDKLRGVLEGRGIRSTSTALASALAGIAISSAPSGLSGSIVAAKLAGPAAVGAGLGFTLIQLMNATKIKTAVVGAAALAALIAGLLTEHNAKNRLVKELDEARAQTGELESLRAENERLEKLEGDAAELKRLRADQLELMRLRGETAALRRRLAESTNAAAPVKSPERPPPSLHKFGGRASAKVPLGQTLVTGGWPMGDGKRLLVMLTPKTIKTDGAAGQVMMEAVLVETPDSHFPKTGGDATIDPDNPRLMGFLDPSQMQTTLTAFKSAEGYRIISSPRVMATDGVQAQFSVGRQVMIDGESVHVGQKIELVPRIAADGIDIELKAEVIQMDDTGLFINSEPRHGKGR